MQGEGALERILRRDRQVAIAAIAVVVSASWGYVLNGAGTGMPAAEMSSPSAALGPAATPVNGSMGGAMEAVAMPVDWTPSYAVLMFFMWWIMMIAMMLPSAAPMILLYAAVARKSTSASAGLPPRVTAFLAGYLLAWALFSAIAAGLQWSFESAGVLSPVMLSSTSALFTAAVLLFAGAYQLSPIKQACLRHCRGPIQFLTQHWRQGTSGALRMGIDHGAYCLGCCWGLMAILFFGGIMNLYWIILLALIVLAEKLLPAGVWLSRLTGGAFIAASLYFLYLGTVQTA